MNGLRALGHAVLVLGLIFATGVPAWAGSATYTAGGFTLTVESRPSGPTGMAYRVMVKDPAGTPVRDARVALVGRVVGAEFRVSGDADQVEVRAVLPPESESGAFAGSVDFPEKGIWNIELRVLSPDETQVLAQVNFAESVGGVMRDETRGLLMLAALSAIVALWLLAASRHRSRRQREVTAHGG